jgi:predicted naringenin-chalcone synthase
MSLEILGLGTALPPFPATQERAAELTSRYSGHDDQQARWLADLYQMAGINGRHLVMLDRLDVLDAPGVHPRGPSTAWRMTTYDQDVRPLALAASRRALAASATPAAAITHLVTVSCTGFAAPGFDIGLIQGLGLASTVQRTHVGFMGCHGALNGLRVARAFAEADPAARVLLCAAELCSLHFQLGFDAGLSVANALFADGAAALVGAGTDRGDWRLMASGSCLVPESEDAMRWTIGDHGFEMGLSKRIGGLIGGHLRPWLVRWLDRHGLALDAIATWAVHPGGPKILDEVVAALGLPRSAVEDSRAVLADCGNMSSPTILFILDRLRRREAPKPCVALAFGPGLVVEGALFNGP